MTAEQLTEELRQALAIDDAATKIRRRLWVANAQAARQAWTAASMTVENVAALLLAHAQNMSVAQLGQIARAYTQLAAAVGARSAGSLISASDKLADLL